LWFHSYIAPFGNYKRKLSDHFQWRYTENDWSGMFGLDRRPLGNVGQYSVSEILFERLQIDNPHLILFKKSAVVQMT
jgi:hypothetical protein